MRETSKLVYTGGYVLTTVFGYILSLKGGDLVSGLNSALAISQECDATCFNYFAVYRASFALVVYHSILSLLLLGCKDIYSKQALIQTRLWPAKTALWILCFVGSFFIPPTFYTNYWIAVIVLSTLFIIIQVLELIDFCCVVAESWISKYDISSSDGGFKYQFLLVSSSLFCYASVLLLASILFVYYANCQVNQAVLSLNLLAVLLITALSITPRIQEKNPKFGLLQASFISLYGTFLVASAIAASDEQSCSILALQSGGGSGLDVAMKYLGVAFTFLSLGYSAFSTGTTNISGDQEEKVSFSFFHLIFVLASFYMAGLLTQWVEVKYTPAIGFIFTKGATSYWIKIATSAVCYLLYVWVLVAPLVFPDRF